jgi:predicted TIM-barrel enzyme
MTEAGADFIVPHMGVTTGGTIGATTAKSLDACVTLIDEWGEAARQVRKDVIVIAHGGPISSPEDVAYVLKRSTHCNGFYGASSMERLPTEIAIKAHVERFRQVAAG